MEVAAFRQRLQKIFTSPPAIYSAIALIVLGPMLGAGFILTLDMAFTPDLRLPESVRSSYLFHGLLHMLNRAVPSEVLQKIMLFLILFLSGIGMHRLFLFTMDGLGLVRGQKASVQKLSPLAYNWPAYMAGVLYMINPFTYSRFMAGQYAVLLGYALLPLFARLLLAFLDRPSVGAACWLAGITVVISIVSIHTVGLIVILSVVCAGLCLWRYRRQLGHVKRIVVYGALSVAVAALASSYWLVPLMQGKGSTAQAISNFDSGDRRAFETLGEGTPGRLGNILSLKGFWADDANLYMVPEDYHAAWRLPVLGLWGLVMVGSVVLWRQRARFLLAWLVISSMVAVLVAEGSVTAWLSERVPYIAGYREPQKFIGLVALAFALCAGYGVRGLIRQTWRKPVIMRLVMAVSILVPVALTPLMFWGFNRQLLPRQYPTDWYRANQLLNADPSHFAVLFLPWHLYTYFGFADRVIVSPAPTFFDKPTIVNDALEFGGASPNKTDPQKQTISHLLETAKPKDQLSAKLAALNIKYILLAREADAGAYSFLSTQQDIRLLRAGTHLSLYQNEAWKPVQGDTYGR